MGKFSVLNCLLFLFLFMGTTAAQNHIAGRVTDADSDTPLPYANVYLSNTTIGSSTGPDGFFEIPNIPPGPYDLVIQYVGYELYVKSVELSGRDSLNIDIRLTPNPVKGEEVVIEARDNKWWRDRVKDFTREFLGSTSYADDCEILNPEILEFVPAQEIDGYRAVTDSILVVDNRALGYRVYVNLVDFKWGQVYKHPVYQLKMHTRFEKLEPSGQRQQKDWEENRRKAYEGSLTHFLKLLATGNLDNRFSFKMYPRDLFQSGREQFLTVVNPDEAKLLGPEELRVEPYEGEHTKKFYMTELLEVDYRSSVALKKSYLSIQGTYAVIDTLGNFYDWSVLNVSGDWADSRVAGLLPANYQP